MYRQQWILLGLLLGLLALLLGGCGAPAPAAEPAKAEAPAATAAPATEAPAAEPVTVEFWTFADFTSGEAGELMKTFIQEFEAANPGIKVNLVGKPDVDIENGIITGASSKVLPDVFTIALNAGFQIVNTGVVKDVGPYWQAMPEAYRGQFNPVVVETLSQDGKVWGLPFTAYSTFLYRNLTVLEKAGIDPAAGIKDWADWLAQMEKVKASGAYGLPDCSVDGWAVMHFLGGVEGVKNGVTADHKTTLTPAQLAAAFDFLKAAGAYGTPVAFNDQAAVDLFTGNQLAFYTMGPWQNPTFEQVKGLKYDYVVIPGQTAATRGGVYGGEWIAVVDGPRAEAAWKWASFLADAPQMSRFGASLGRASYNKLAVEKPELAANKLLQTTVAVTEHGMADAAYFKPLPLGFRVPLADAAAAVVQGQLTPAEAAQQAIEQINGIIAEAAQ